MATEYSRKPTFTSEPTKAFAYGVTPSQMGSKAMSSQAGVGPGSKSVGGNAAQDFNPTDNKTERVDYDQKPMGRSGGKGSFNPANVDKYNVLP